MKMPSLNWAHGWRKPATTEPGRNHGSGGHDQDSGLRDHQRGPCLPAFLHSPGHPVMILKSNFQCEKRSWNRD